MKIAVVGATGMVGEVMLKVLAERNFPITELIPVASEKSIGKEVTYLGKNYTVVGMQTAVDMKADIAIFSAGGILLKNGLQNLLKLVPQLSTIPQHGEWILPKN
jgi:aspartate-semialdehyde dehydrogenase